MKAKPQTGYLPVCLSPSRARYNVHVGKTKARNISMDPFWGLFDRSSSAGLREWAQILRAQPCCYSRGLRGCLLPWDSVPPVKQGTVRLHGQRVKAQKDQNHVRPQSAVAVCPPWRTEVLGNIGTNCPLCCCEYQLVLRREKKERCHGDCYHSRSWKIKTILRLDCHWSYGKDLNLVPSMLGLCWNRVKQ